MSTKTDCVCEWDEDDNVISFCGAHMELHRKMTARKDEEIERLEKRVSDAGWEADARREQDEIARAREWR